jgi:hypothetical protein
MNLGRIHEMTISMIVSLKRNAPLAAEIKISINLISKDSRVHDYVLVSISLPFSNPISLGSILILSFHPLVHVSKPFLTGFNTKILLTLENPST